MLYSFSRIVLEVAMFAIVLIVGVHVLLNLSNALITGGFAQLIVRVTRTSCSLPVYKQLMCFMRTHLFINKQYDMFFCKY